MDNGFLVHPSGLNGYDLEHLRNVWHKRNEDHMREQTDEEYDEGGPEVVMTSIGYVDLWLDGEVCANGVVIYNLEGE